MQSPSPARAVKHQLRSLEERTRLAARSVLSEKRCLPDFVIIGGQRCGTSSLYDWLVDHRQVLPATRKEVQYFTLHHDKGEAWYRAHFALEALKRWEHFRQGRQAITGEATPYYLAHPHAPARMKALLPHPTLIVLLRDPVKRAFSHYLHERRLGREARSFADALAHEAANLPAELARLEADPGYYSELHHRHTYLHRGDYLPQLQHWYAHFPKECFLVLPAEELYDTPDQAFRKVLTWLGLAPGGPKHLAARNQGKKESALDPGLERELVEHFAPRNQALYDWLGRDLGWSR